MARNIELKARLDHLDDARRIAVGLATAHLGVQRQIDTYFFCSNGRLKLREIEAQPAQLVWYTRPDSATAKGSDYILTPVDDAAALKASLAGALGVETVVVKEREIFLWHNVRIHLDNVQSLGSFLEFEAVLDALHDDAEGKRQLDWLSEQFCLSAEQLLAGSYCELRGAE